jgi:hypothetical protein
MSQLAVGKLLALKDSFIAVSRLPFDVRILHLCRSSTGMIV